MRKDAGSTSAPQNQSRLQRTANTGRESACSVRWFNIEFPPRLGPNGGGLIFLDQGLSNYQALNLRVRHSFANGFLLAANYTWSKSIDTAYTEAQDEQGFGDGAGGNAGQSYNQVDLLNPYNNKKLSFSDVPQRVVITGVYELPFGRGKQVAINNRVASAALSGWRVGGVYTFQMGFPLGAGGGLNGNSLDSRADVNPGEPLVLPA
jgi:hypothetical protein